MTYYINSWSDLDDMRLDLSGDYVLTQDLTSEDSDYDGIGSAWVPVGDYDENPFTGSFDGGGYKIEGLTCFHTDSYAGLFGYAEYLNVENLTFENAIIESTQSYVGILCGRAHHPEEIALNNCHIINGSVELNGNYGGGFFGGIRNHGHIVIHNCTINGLEIINNDGQGSFGGGLVGLHLFLNSIDITDCNFTNIYIEGFIDRAGIVAGSVHPNIIENVSSSGEILMENTVFWSGGFAGSVRGGLIKNCDSYIIVNTTVPNETHNGFGGFIGENLSTIENCTASGEINNIACGGFCYRNRKVITDCFTDVTVNSISDAAGFCYSNTDTGEIYDCTCNNTVEGSGRVGGFLGSALDDSETYKCYTSNTVTNNSADGKTGGFVAEIASSSAMVRDCYCTGDVYSNGDGFYGGFVGTNIYLIYNCYATGSVISSAVNSARIGGFIGENGSSGDIRNCYSVGSILEEDSEYIGGFAGYNNEGDIENCGWFTDAGGDATVAIGYDVTEGGPLNVTHQTSTVSDFYDKTYGVYTELSPHWDFTEPIWYEYTSDFPKFVTEEYYERFESPTIRIEEDLEYYIKIKNWTQLKNIKTTSGQKYVLTNNLSKETSDYNGIGDSWEPIGSKTDKFKGELYGNGYTISDLKINSEDLYTGLISVCGNSIIKNLGLKNLEINSTVEQVGALAGRVEGDVEIDNCYVENGTIEGSTDVAGLIGYVYYNHSVSIKNCYVQDLKIQGDNIGGLIGFSSDSNIDNCYAKCELNGQRVGGLVERTHGSIYNSYADCSIVASISAGGLVSRSYANINKCYSLGSIQSNGDAGGFGANLGGEVNNCYSEVTTEASGDSGGFVANTDSGGEIYNCYSIGEVSSQGLDSAVGGFVGSHSGTILNSYSIGPVFEDEVADFGGFAGGVYTTNYTIHNCGWYIGNNDDAEYAIGLLPDGTSGSVQHEESNFSVFYDESHPIYDSVNPFWNFENIWISSILHFPLFEKKPINENINISDSIIINPGQEHEFLAVTDEILLSYVSREKINSKINTAILKMKNIYNTITTAIKVNVPLNNKFITKLLNKVNIDSKINTVKKDLTSTFNLIRFQKRVKPLFQNIFNSKKIKTENIKNNFRMITTTQIPGNAGPESLGKEYISVLINDVDQNDVDIDSIYISRNLNSSSTASFTLARPFDASKPDKESKVVIKYNNNVLFTGYITSINPSDNPDNISINCQDKYWKENKKQKFFTVGHDIHEEVEEGHNIYSTPKKALLGEYGKDINFGNFVPETITFIGNNKSEVLSSLVKECGNYDVYYDVNEDIKIKTHGKGDVINLEAQELNKNINLYSVINHNFEEDTSNIINRFLVQMADSSFSKTYERHIGDKNDVKDTNTRWTSEYIVSYRVYPKPMWDTDSKFEKLAKNNKKTSWYSIVFGSGKTVTSKFGYDNQDPTEPEWKYNEVFVKYRLPYLGDIEKWSDAKSPQIYIDPPHLQGQLNRKPGWSAEGFSFNYETGIFQFNQPTYYTYYDRVNSITRKRTKIRRPNFYLVIWKIIEEAFYVILPPPTDEEPDLPDGWQSVHPHSFWTDKMGDFPEERDGYLTLSGLRHEVSKKVEGSNTTTEAYDDTPYARDIANWELTKVCDKKIEGNLSITLDAFTFYNIDLNKRIKISNIRDEIFNINDVSINLSNWEVTLNLSRQRKYKRTNSIQKASVAASSGHSTLYGPSATRTRIYSKV